MNITQPWHDIVVAEIHAERERLAEQYHNDLLAYSKAAETHCRALGFMIVSDQPNGHGVRPATMVDEPDSIILQDLNPL